MAKLTQYRRLFWLALLLGAGFLSLGYRLVDLQVVRHDDLARAAQKNTRHLVYREPRRGVANFARQGLRARACPAHPPRVRRWSASTSRSTQRACGMVISTNRNATVVTADKL